MGQLTDTLFHLQSTKKDKVQDMVMHTYDFSTQEAEAGRKQV
jgi:uncharacterized protein YaiE (UPF0345 family)